MSKRLSDLGIAHRRGTAVDYYAAPNAETHIVHAEGCQRAMTADGICSCDDPLAFVVTGEPRSKRGR